MKLKLLLFGLFCLSVQATFGQIPTNGLVAYYPFSGNANDQSNNSNDGTVYGATLSTDRFGDSNSAYAFNGSSNYIEVANSSSLQSPSNALTLSSWVQINSTTNLNWILDKRINTPSAPYSSYGLFTVAANTSITSGVSAGSMKSAGSQSIQLNTWMHIAMTYDGSKIIFYVNGVAKDSANVSGNIQYSSMPLFIGKSPTNSAWMNGKIDDIRIYNVALNPSEIHSLSIEGIVCNLLITEEPSDSNTAIGMPAAFEVGASGGGIKYAWEVNDGSGFKPISSCLYSGTSASKLQVLGCLPWMDGYAYRCILDNDTCQDTSAVAYLGVDTAYYQTYIDTIPYLDTVIITQYDTVDIFDTTYSFVTIYDTIGHIDTLVIYDTTYITITTYDSVSVTDTLVINTPLGGTTPAINTFKVYPNPAKDHIYIDNGNYSTMGAYTIEITNALGQSVFSSSVNQAQFYIDLSTWTGNGLYMLYLKDGSGNMKETRKIILQ